MSVQQTINEGEKKIPVIKEVDVLVCGGGPAGIISAIASARNGARTLLIEKYGFLGGNATMGLPLLSFHNDKKEKIINGIPYELVERLRIVEGAMPDQFDPHHTSFTIIDGEKMKYIADDMCKEAEVELLFHTLAVSTIIDGQKITGVIIESKSGRQAILSKVVIDATGDGDIAAMAGCPYEKGRKDDKLMQPPTLMFHIGGVNIDEMMSTILSNPEKYQLHNHVPLDYTSEDYHKKKRRFIFAGFDNIIEECRNRGEFSIPMDTVLFITLPRLGEIAVNMTKMKGIDGTDVFDLSKAEIVMRRQIFEIMRFFRKYLPGFKNCYLISSAHQVGIRETRRIVGEYVLTKEDMIANKKFSDTIARGGYYIDLHNPSPDGFGATPGINVRFKNGYYIPYRCLIPKKIDNLLVAGRCISVSWEALGSTRVMAICMALGQAAGTAAALCVKENKIPKSIDVEELQKQLLRDKANLDRI